MGKLFINFHFHCDFCQVAGGDEQGWAACCAPGGGRMLRCCWDWIVWATFLCGIFPNARHTCAILLLFPLLWLCPCHSRSPAACSCDMLKTAQNCRNPLFFTVQKYLQVWKRKERCKSFHEVSACSVFYPGFLFQLYTEACILMAPLSFSIKSNLSAKEVKFCFSVQIWLSSHWDFQTLYLRNWWSQFLILFPWCLYWFFFSSRRVIFTVVSKLSFCLHLQQVIAQLGQLHVFWASPALCTSSPDNLEPGWPHVFAFPLLLSLQAPVRSGEGQQPQSWMGTAEVTRQAGYSSSFSCRYQTLVVPLDLWRNPVASIKGCSVFLFLHTSNLSSAVAKTKFTRSFSQSMILKILIKIPLAVLIPRFYKCLE